MNLLILVVVMSLMSKFCSGSSSGATFALAGSPWSSPNPPPWHFSASPTRATGRSS